MSDRPTFLYVASYDSVDEATADFEAVIELHVAGLVGTFDAAVIEKSEDGKVHVHKTELPTQHGAWTGIGVGAVLGILFPPSIIATTVAGGVIGGVTAHLWKGMSRGDLKDLGEALDEGQAAIVVIGEATVDEAIEKATRRAKKQLKKQIDADAEAVKKEIDAA
jgi:uncharacterized membrane protein